MTYIYPPGTERWRRHDGEGDVRGYRPRRGWKAGAELLDVHPVTGRPLADSPFTMTYLIDSNQDRTSNNPLPSTVICLLQATGRGPLTRSARP